MPHASLEASFGRAAGRYAQYAGVQRDLADWLVEWAPRNRAGSALELGAGPGTLTERMLPWAGCYLASDLSSAMCAAGRERFPEVEWRRASAEHPPAGPWDWVLSSSMLQWVQEPAAVLQACRKVLVPGGRLLAGLFVSPTLPEWEATVPDGAAKPPLRWRAAEEWCDAAKTAGLKLIRSESESRTVIYPSARDFLRSLHAIGAAPRRALPPATLRRILAAYDATFKVDAASTSSVRAATEAAPRSGVRSTWTFFRIEASN